MAEAAAVVGLVASIVTLVDLGVKIVSRIQEFITQTTDIPQSFRSLADRLPLLIRTLQQIQVRAQGGAVSDDVARDLKTLVDSVSVQTRLIEHCLRKTASSADISRLEKTIKALQSLMKDERVTQAIDKVHRSIDVLVLHQTTTSVDLSDCILQILARLHLHSIIAPQRLGLWLNHAPKLDLDAFIGRTAELQQLDDWLSPRANTPSQQVVSITGMGGLGKTQLSLAYARQYGNQYSSVFWLNAQNKLSLRQSILTLSRRIFHNHGVDTGDSDEERQVQRVQRWLSEPGNDQWLIIFDDYDDPALPNIHSSTGFDIQEFFPSRAQGSILITTRSTRLSFSRQLVLQKLNDIPSQLAILSRRAGRNLSRETGSQRLVVRLDGLPLALATAGMYIGQTRCSCTEYLTMYDEMWNELHASKSGALPEYVDRTLSSTWTISLDQVYRQDADAVQLLKFFALLNNEDIWYELLQAGAPDGPAWMKRVTTTVVRFVRAMTTLQDYSLLEVTASSYYIHPCVHDWLLGQFQLSSDRSWFTAAIACITRSRVDINSLQYWNVSQRLVQHVQRLNQKPFQPLWQIYCSEETNLEASHDFGLIYQGLNRFFEAEQMYIRALAGKEKVLGADHTSTLSTVNNLGLLYADQGKLAEAEQMYTRALAGYEKALGVEHTSTLDTANNFGSLYKKQGKLVKAEEMYIRALAGCEKVLGTDYTLTLNIVNNLGNLYCRQGKQAEAEQMYTRALAGLEETLGSEHSSTLNTVNNLGGLYMDQGKLVEAEQMYNRALTGYEKVLESEHSSTLNTVNNLGTLYMGQGKLAEAEQMYNRALAGYEKVLGADHTSTLTAINNLGILYAAQGKLAEAEQMYTRALAGFEKALGAEDTLTLGKVDSLGVFNNLGVLYADQGKLVEAEQMYDRARAGYERTLGHDHALTQRAIRNLNQLYNKQSSLKWPGLDISSTKWLLVTLLLVTLPLIMVLLAMLLMVPMIMRYV